MEYAIDLEGTPTLEEDMANFPDKSEEEVKVARHLWAVGAVLIKEHYNDSFYASRAALRMRSLELAKLLPSARSWPILSVAQLVGQRSEYGNINLGMVIDLYIRFTYSNELSTDSGKLAFTPAESMLLFGEKTKDETFFDISLNHYFKSNTQKLDQDGRLRMFDALLSTSKSKLEVEQAYKSRVLIQLLTDKIVWESINDDIGVAVIAHCKNKHNRDFLEGRIAEAQISPPRFSPQHPSNRPKYFVTRSVDTAVVDNVQRPKLKREPSSEAEGQKMSKGVKFSQSVFGNSSKEPAVKKELDEEIKSKPEPKSEDGDRF